MDEVPHSKRTAQSILKYGYNSSFWFWRRDYFCHTRKPAADSEYEAIIEAPYTSKPAADSGSIFDAAYTR